MAYATNGNVEIYYETFGDPANPALLLINGLGSQCVNYDTEWCEMFADAGLYTIRFDNRDVGLTTWFDGAPASIDDPAYTSIDMADDAIAVLDDLGIERAHVHGISMGGMIAQRVAIHHPDRLNALIIAMSATGDPDMGYATPEATEVMSAPPATSRDGYIEEWIAGQRVWGSPAFADEDRWRFEAERAFDRAYNPQGPGRQVAALRAVGSTVAELGNVAAPTLVIHGSADTLISPDGGQQIADLIPAARFELVAGLGHDYPPGMWKLWTKLVTDFLADLDNRS